MLGKLPLAAAVLACASPLCFGQDRPRLQAVPGDDAGLKTGPKIGERMPAFEAPDQHGKLRNFESLKGPRGLVLLVVRSADW